MPSTCEEYGHCHFIHTSTTHWTNETLVRNGYLGCSPEKVTLAFPIRLFKIFRQIHRVCPRYTLDGLSKTLTSIHNCPRRPTLAEQLSTAYDVYLEIIRRADARSHTALGRNAAWYIQNVCAPCLYKTVNEAPLKYSFLGCMDGNNSLKLVDATFRASSVRPDNRASTSFRWLSPEQVDVFKDEVNNSQKVCSSSPHLDCTDSLDNDDVAWLNVNELNGDEAEELEKCLDTCVERWKAAGPEARKKMFALFAIAGIFLSVCRHGHVLVMCDMIRSGELMKYPHAIVKWLLDHYGADIGLGYDIMCAFFKTLRRSSLGAKVVAMRLRGVVPALHGHAHNRACQIGWHPLYVDGVGLEDFEECERTFAKSNNLAAATRLATPFHRQQQIDEHFYFHDQDKHEASGNFIYQNYRQALEKITLNRAQLSTLEAGLGTSAEDYENDHLTEVNKNADNAKVQYNQLDYNIMHNTFKGPQIAAVRTRYRTSWTKYLAVEEGVCRFEEEHSIPVRWTTTSKEYQEALVLTTERKYRTALREVERLVVSRLFELTKLGMSGYKLREKISKALRTQAEAIRRALQTYNEAAVALNPPRERLTWMDIISKTSLAEFDLLRDTRMDIHDQPWTHPARREAMVLYFGIKRAKEEIQRLNIEICRLITSMYDQHVDYHRAISSTLLINPPLASYLDKSWFIGIHSSFLAPLGHIRPSPTPRNPPIR
ncbi:hypothetical protein B0H10DRAFT_1786918 [Mycena sp. CBHHK59/15]|nr:hypothetical protein B0H10DRAFT_1786918 [Mycena sp. CBHHK59/15]